MINGYNMKGEKIYSFLSTAELADKIGISKSLVDLAFERDRQLNYTSLLRGEIIFHDEETTSKTPDEDFGYPEPKCSLEALHEQEADLVNCMCTEGSIIVTPNDPYYDIVKHFVDQDQDKEIQGELDLASAEAKVLCVNYVNTPPLSQEDIDEYFDVRNAFMAGGKATPVVSEKDKLGGQDGGSYSANGSSAHYKKAILEYVDKQERCYGTFLAYGLCFQQVDKYRDRAGKKEGVPADKDLVKANWYDSATQYLRAKIDLYNTLDPTEHDFEDFEEDYGLGRAEYITMPAGLAVLLTGEFPDLQFNASLKGLGDIVNEAQANG
jgi:hypothetical protein